MNEIYLATIGKDSAEFTVVQTTALFDIASQCPMLGGNAVFKARSLYWLINAGQEFDDAVLCLQHGIIVKNTKPPAANSVNVVPNPAGDDATVVLERTFAEPGLFVLYDAVGTEVLRFVVPIDRYRVPFGTASLAPALYHYKVLARSGVFGTGKLTIVH